MKSAILILLLLIATFSISAQDQNAPLAIANGKTFTLADIPRDVADEYLSFPKRILEYRVPLIESQINNIVLEIEAGSRGISIEKLYEAEVIKKVPDPTDAEVKTIYENNKSNLIELPFGEIKKRIIAYLRMTPEKIRRDDYIESLKQKYPARLLKDIRLPGLKTTDQILVVGPRTITFGEFVDANKFSLYDQEANLYDKVYASVKQVVDATVYSVEAESLGISISDLVAKEITNRISNFNEAEYSRLQSALENRLYKKYRVSFMLKEPEPLVQSISADDDPFTGAANAPITIVMFSDYQCPACGSIYPILKKVIAEYPGKIRFVVRDFPLINIHENAFLAAIAANAAKKQGKFFEYAELLYANQNQLDETSLLNYAKRLNLNLNDFKNDLKNPSYVGEVEKDMSDGNKYGVGSTPTIFVNGVKVRLLSEDGFRKSIDRFAKLLD